MYRPRSNAMRVMTEGRRVGQGRGIGAPERERGFKEAIEIVASIPDRTVG